jgi:hypothetical protein
MKKSDRKVKKKRTLAMSHKELIFVSKIRHGLAKNEQVKTFAEACRQLNVNQANARRAVLGHSQGERALEIKEAILKMANINAVQITTKPQQPTTGEAS